MSVLRLFQVLLSRLADSRLNWESADLHSIILTAYKRTAGRTKGHPHAEVPFSPWVLSEHQTRSQHAKTATFRTAEQTGLLP